jgi:hypothetical protein
LVILLESGIVPEPDQIKQLMGLVQPRELSDLKPLVPVLALAGSVDTMVTTSPPSTGRPENTECQPSSR